jgi:4-hydroxy-tetrahydrodipicolinate reductase
MAITVCLAGATGWAGSELARGIADAEDLSLVAAVSRTHAGHTLGEALGDSRLNRPVYATAAEALRHGPDVYFDYTRPDVAKDNIIAALEHRAHVAVGTSGLTETDYEAIDRAARDVNRGVLAAGNFALTAVLLLKFAEMAAHLIPHWEILDYAHDNKVDAHSGTTRELASRLRNVREPRPTVPIDETIGSPEARGATVSSSQIHSVRLPGFVISPEIIQ